MTVQETRVLTGTIGVRKGEKEREEDGEMGIKRGGKQTEKYAGNGGRRYSP